MLKKWMEKSKKDQRGLTLVELLAVVVILAIVAAIAFVLIGNVIENSKKDAHIANAQQIISAVKLAESSGDLKSDDLTGEGGGVDVLSGDNKLNTLGSTLDPWSKNDYTSAIVSKENGVYKIKLDSSNDNCNINHTEKQLQQGRKVVCKK